MQLSTSKLQKMIFWPAIIIGSAIFLSTIMFIYLAVYQTVIKGAEIYDLRSTVPLENIDIKKFNQLIEKIDAKTSRQEAKLKNLFN